MNRCAAVTRVTWRCQPIQGAAFEVVQAQAGHRAGRPGPPPAGRRCLSSRGNLSSRRTGYPGSMRRIVVLGRGGAGKSTLAARLGAALALSVIELDKHFWAPDLTPTPKNQWTQI